MTFSISASLGMVVAVVWKGSVLIFLSYTSDKLFYEANKQNEIIE